MAVVTAPNLRAALRVIADAAGRLLADGSESSAEVRLELFARLAAAEETARDALARPVVESVADAVRVAGDVLAGEISTSPEDLERIAREVVETLVSDPVLTQHADGNVTIAWPFGAVLALVSRPALDGVAAEVSALRRALLAIRETLRTSGYAP